MTNGQDKDLTVIRGEKKKGWKLRFYRRNIQSYSLFAKEGQKKVNYSFSFCSVLFCYEGRILVLLLTYELGPQGCLINIWISALCF